jgi:hypothetical protein
MPKGGLRRKLSVNGTQIARFPSRRIWSPTPDKNLAARKRYTETRREGALTDKEKSQVHAWKMVPGRTYVIDLEGDAFDAFLALEDAAGKLLAENDDISPDNRNSRLVFTAKADGSYRIVATSFQEAGTGPYFTPRRAPFSARELVHLRADPP